MNDGGKRRLSAVMFADVVGFTAMAQRDEASALHLLGTLKRRLLGFFARHRGRLVKTAGDGFLVVFDSALDAVRCAVEIQSGPGPREAARLRVGVHLGDVVEAEGDVMGDTVNVASRIQAAAEPGGICVSQQVYDQVRNKLAGCSFERLELPALKNVSLPIGVYRVIQRRAGVEVRDSAGQGVRRIAVIPLSNFSPSTEDSYIADAITDELINALSKVQGLRVIARTSVMHYRDDLRSILEIGERLRVGSVLQGNVLKSGNRIRVSLQLVDVQSEVQFWSDKYDRDLSDIFAVQDDIARRVAESLTGALVAAERKERRTEDIDAYTHYLRGRTLLYDRREQAMKDALLQFKKAVKKDAGFARAYAGMADAYYLLGYFEHLPRERAYGMAKKLARRALSLDGTLADAHATLGAILDHYNYDYAAAEVEFKHAISLDPNYAQARHWYALTLAAMGRLDDALEEMGVAEECDPLSPQIRTVRGAMLSWAGRDDEALAEWEGVLETNPDFHLIYYQRAIHYIERGDRDRALADMEKKERLTPGDTSCIFLAGYIASSLGDRRKAMDAVRKLKLLQRRGPVPSTYISVIYGSLGEKEEFFARAKREIDERTFEPVFLRYSRLLSGIRADPRYGKLLSSVGLPYQAHSAAPPTSQAQIRGRRGRAA